MSTIHSSAATCHFPDEALEGELCRNCSRPFHEGDPVILATVPAGYEAAYCSAACKRADQKVRAGEHGACEQDTQELLVTYGCPSCGHRWHEVWSCTCDSECPQCGQSNIQASTWEDIT